ncbi:MAG: hypothetical protein R3C68_12750 [Myxococcota bacterium]
MGQSSATDRRIFPRASQSIAVHLSLNDGKRRFEATIQAADVSLTGVFFTSEFFIAPGVVLDLEFKMPNDDRLVQTRGVIVREVRLERTGDVVNPGFAMHFTEYVGDAKSILAASFLSAELDNFIDDYLSRRLRKPLSASEHLRDVLIAWEVNKMELNPGESDLTPQSTHRPLQGGLLRARERDFSQALQ